MNLNGNQGLNLSSNKITSQVFETHLSELVQNVSCLLFLGLEIGFLIVAFDHV